MYTNFSIRKCKGMTTLVAWIGVDTHGPASVYIASDSRISWKNVENTWDSVRKVFAAYSYPELFGYSGRVEFPVHILNQLVNTIDNGFLFSSKATFDEKLEAITKFIQNSFSEVPRKQSGSGTIIYATRIGNKMRSRFHVVEIKFNDGAITFEEKPLSTSSDIVACSGSGKRELKSMHEKWRGGVKEIGFSRFVFGALCDSLKEGNDKFSGGAPQLVGLYRHTPGLNFGIIFNGKRYFSGKLMDDFNSLLPRIEWRNELFERCDGANMSKLKDAQAQPRV